MAAADITAIAVPRFSPALMAQLELKIERIPESGCWIWMGAISERYGAIRFLGRCWLAHRLIYELLVEAVPADRDLCHHCDVGFCVNPSHMFVGTHSENMVDMVRKGRNKGLIPKFGDAHPMVAISDALAEQIGRDYASGRRPVDIARAMGIRYERVKNLVFAKKRVAFLRGLRAAQVPEP